MTPSASRTRIATLPLGKAARATRVVSSGIGSTGLGCSDTGEPPSSLPGVGVPRRWRDASVPRAPRRPPAPADAPFLLRAPRPSGIRQQHLVQVTRAGTPAPGAAGP